MGVRAWVIVLTLQSGNRLRVDQSDLGPVAVNCKHSIVGRGAMQRVR